MRRLLLALLVLLALPARAWAVYEGYVIPNAGTAAFSAQSRVFAQDLQIIADGSRGNGIVFAAGACSVLPQASPNMTTRLTTGCTIVSQGSTATVATGNMTHAAAHATLVRIDIVSANNAGTTVVTAGTPAAIPSVLPPAIPQSGGANNIVLAFVYIPAADTAIDANQITDKRIFVNTPGVGTGAATTLKYITQTPEGTLSQEFALSTLATGLLQNTITTGIPTSIAPTDDNVVVGNGTTWQLKALPTCSGGTNALTYNISTNAFGCNTIAGGGSVPTGTGFTHITAGSQDAAAKLVDTVDINASQVTYAKIQNVSAASRLLGRGSAGGAGAPEEITLGSGLTMTGTSLAASAGGGDASTNTATSVDSEVTLFSSTTGKLLKRATGTGPAKLTAGVLSAAAIDLSGAEATGVLAAARMPAHTGDVTSSSGSVALTLANIPTATPMAGSLLATAIAAPGTPAAGKGSIYVDSTTKTLCVKSDAGVVTCTSGTGAAVTTTGSPATGQIAVMTGATSITSTSDLTYSASVLGIRGGGQASLLGTEGIYVNPNSANVQITAETSGGTEVGLIATAGSGYMGSWTNHPLSLRTNNADRVTVAAAGGVTVASLASAGTQCVQASSAGLLSGTGASCGGGSGPTLSTFATSLPADMTTTVTINNLTVRTVQLFFLPGAITLNQLTISPDVVTTNGALKLCIYSADGASKLVDVTTGTPVSNTPLSTSVGSVVLPAGEYYAVVGCQAACNLIVRSAPAETGSAQAFGLNSPAGKKKWHGTVTHTSTLCNGTLGAITGTATAYPVLRGDN